MKLLNAIQQELESLDHDQLNELEAAEKANVEAAQHEALGKRFDTRFKSGSWLQQQWPRRKAAEWYSFIFHGISGSGAMYAFFLLFGVIVWSWMGLLLAGGVIFLLEREKRKWSDQFWDSFVSSIQGKINWKALSINVCLFLSSLLLTIGGAYFGLKDNMPGAKQLGISSDPVATALKQQLVEAKAALADFEANKSNYTSKGEVYYKRLDTWSGLQDKVNAIDQQLTSQFGIISIENQSVLDEWMQKRWFVVLMGVLICLIAEIGFEYNMYFRSKYDYKYYLAKKLSRQRKASPPSAQHNQPAKPAQPAQPNGHYVPAMSGPLDFGDNSPLTPQSVATPIGVDPGPQPGAIPVATTGEQEKGPPGSRTIVDPFQGKLRKPVATGSYPVATDKPVQIDVRADMLIQALRNANSNLGSWASKPDGDAKTRNLERYQATYNEAEKELKEKGILVDEVLKKRGSHV